MPQIGSDQYLVQDYDAPYTDPDIPSDHVIWHLKPRACGWPNSLAGGLSVHGFKWQLCRLGWAFQHRRSSFSSSLLPHPTVLQRASTGIPFEGLTFRPYTCFPKKFSSECFVSTDTLSGKIALLILSIAGPAARMLQSRSCPMAHHFTGHSLPHLTFKAWELKFDQDFLLPLLFNRSSHPLSHRAPPFPPWPAKFLVLLPSPMHPFTLPYKHGILLHLLQVQTESPAAIAQYTFDRLSSRPVLLVRNSLPHRAAQ